MGIFFLVYQYNPDIPGRKLRVAVGIVNWRVTKTSSPPVLKYYDN